jgi:hypothetical protein
MTPTARRFTKALLARFPRFEHGLRVLPTGDFEAFVRAPRTSNAGVLVCMSRGTDVWVRLNPPNTFSSIDTPRELLTIVEGLLADDLLFVVLFTTRKWSGTTLVRRGERPAQGAGESARLLSWSGKHDRRIRATRLRRPAGRIAAR